MVQRPVFWLVAAAALVTGQSAAAAPLTIERAVQRALGRAPEIAAARAAEAAARARVGQARSAYLPRADLGVTYQLHWPKNELPIELPELPGLEPPGDIDDIHRFQARLKVGYRLFDLARGTRVAAARHGVAARRAAAEQEAAKLAFEVRMTFLAAIYARDVIRIASESLKQARREERRAHIRQQVGTGSQVALAQARVRVASLTGKKRRAQIESRRYLRHLASLLGTPKPPRIRGDLARLASRGARRALGQTPLLRQLRAGEAAARAQAKERARGFWPTVTLFGAAELLYPRALQLEFGPAFAAGVTVQWDLFDGLLRRARAAEARQRATGLAAQQRAATRKLRRRLIDLKARQRAARVDLRTARETLEQQRIYLRVARAAVATGTGTELDVHNAELGVDSARIAVQKALFDSARARAERLLVFGFGAARGGGSAPHRKAGNR